MGLLERVGRLIRANLNDLVDRAESPQTMLTQLLLDMQNQLLQVKTQLAIALADRHILDRKRKESEAQDADWLRKAEVALGKGREDLARDAVDKALGCRQAAANYAQQSEDQRLQVEQLKSALRQLERKLAETRTRADVLIARRRRAKAVTRARPVPVLQEAPALDRMEDKVLGDEALSAAWTQLAAPDTAGEFEALDRDQRVEQVLAEIRRKRISGLTNS